MKYHIEGGCARNRTSAPLTREQFINTLSSQRCRVCERMTFGETEARTLAVKRGEMVEAREGETMRLTRGTATVIRHVHYIEYRMPHVANGAWRILEEFEGANAVAECRTLLETYRRSYPKIEFRSRSGPKHERATYAKHLPEIGEELLADMEKCRALEKRATAMRRRIVFQLNLNWKGYDITQAKTIAKSEYERTTGERCYDAAVMPAF